MKTTEIITKKGNDEALKAEQLQRITRLIQIFIQIDKLLKTKNAKLQSQH